MGTDRPAYVFQVKITAELLEQSGFRIEPGFYLFRDVPPLLQFGLHQTKLAGENLPAGRPTIAQQRGDVQRAPYVPTRHDVCIGVVVDVFVILVGTDDATDVTVSVCLQPGAAGPEAACFQQYFGAGLEQEIVVTCCMPVLPDGICDVGADMLLLPAAQHRDDLAVGADYLLRCHLRARPCTFPGVKRATPPHSRGFCPRPGKRVKAIHQ